MYAKFRAFFPNEVMLEHNELLIQQNMKVRIEAMNNVCEMIKDLPFHICETFYGLHGNHRNCNDSKR